MIWSLVEDDVDAWSGKDELPGKIKFVVRETLEAEKDIDDLTNICNS